MTSDVSSEQDFFAASKFIRLFKSKEDAPAFFYFRQTTSTIDEARTLLKSETPFRYPALVLAETQTAGRGQREHRWWTGFGSLAFTLITSWESFGRTRGDSWEISMEVAQYLILGLNTHFERLVHRTKLRNIPEFHIKSPNDIYCRDKKLAGILIESPTPRTLLVSIGINVNNRVRLAPVELRDSITSLIDLVYPEQEKYVSDPRPNRLDREQLLADIMISLLQ